MKPIDLLRIELRKLLDARDKSVEAFGKGIIDKDLHNAHITNLTPLIEEYKYVLRVIETYA